jgi:hypothetical protein
MVPALSGCHRVRGKDSVRLKCDCVLLVSMNSFLPERADTGHFGEATAEP